MPLTNQDSLWDAEDNTSGLLNRGGIADLPLFRTLLAIHKKSREPSFWEVIDSFVLVAYASLAASRTLLPQLLACLNFKFRRFILLVQPKKVISMKYDSSTSKTMEISEVWLDTYDEGYIHQFQPEPTQKIHYSSRSIEFKDILPWNIPQMITETIPISMRIGMWWNGASCFKFIGK